MIPNAKDLEAIRERMAAWHPSDNGGIAAADRKALLLALDEAVAERDALKVELERLRVEDAPEYAAAMAYHGQAMEHDKWRMERDEAVREKAQLREALSGIADQRSSAFKTYREDREEMRRIACVALGRAP